MKVYLVTVVAVVLSPNLAESPWIIAMTSRQFSAFQVSSSVSNFPPGDIVILLSAPLHNVRPGEPQILPRAEAWKWIPDAKAGLLVNPGLADFEPCGKLLWGKNVFRDPVILPAISTFRDGFNRPCPAGKLSSSHHLQVLRSFSITWSVRTEGKPNKCPVVDLCIHPNDGYNHWLAGRMQ
jgi:hypothetical protein